MMTGVTVTRHIRAPQEVVFRAATDFPSAPGRIKSILKLEMLTNGPVGAGTRFRETRRMFNREATEELEVTRFDPPQGYTLGAENHGCRYCTELAFIPHADGTEVRMTFAAEPLTMFAKAMSFLMRPMMKMVTKECVKDLDDLAESLERHSAQQA